MSRPHVPLAIALLAALAGCGRAVGPERMETATARGRVHARGVPIATGWIEFSPVDGTVGLLRSARLGPDGRFVATRVPVGRVAMRLAGPPAARTGDRDLDDFLFMARRMALIRRVVPPGGGPLDVDLRDEAVAFKRQYGARR